MSIYQSSKVTKLREDTQQDQKEAPTEEQEDELYAQALHIMKSDIDDPYQQ